MPVQQVTINRQELTEAGPISNSFSSQSIGKSSSEVLCPILRSAFKKRIRIQETTSKPDLKEEGKELQFSFQRKNPEM